MCGRLNPAVQRGTTRHHPRTAVHHRGDGYGSTRRGSSIRTRSSTFSCRRIDDTAPALVDLGRLSSLLVPIDTERVTLTLGETNMAPIGLRAGRIQAVLKPDDRWQEHRRRSEQLLCEFLAVESVEADGDGDYPVATPEGHGLWVRMRTDTDPVSVQVFCVLPTQVDPNAGLFEELNSINAAATHVKVLWAAGAVMAEVDVVAETLDLVELGNALQVVRRTADRYHSVLNSYFGSAPHDPPDTDSAD